MGKWVVTYMYIIWLENSKSIFVLFDDTKICEGRGPDLSHI